MGVVAATGGCASASTPPANAGNISKIGEAGGVGIDVRTPPGIRAKQVVDMLNSDWPIGQPSVRTLAAPDVVDEVVTVMETLWWDRPFEVRAVDVRAGAATLHLLTSYGAGQHIHIHTDDAGMVDRFDLDAAAPPIHSFADIDAVLRNTGARYSYQVARVNDGACEPIAGVNTDESLPLASIFKLYVLLAVAEEVRDGSLSWTDQLAVTVGVKALGSSGLSEINEGDRVSVLTAAEAMIATSDNAATDMLIARVGRAAVERALVTGGHHDPAAMTPFPTVHELFSIGWGRPDLRQQWRHGSVAQRARLLDDVASRPYDPDPQRAHDPASAFAVEWYGSAGDICRLHVALQKAAVGPAAPVRRILAAVPGIDLPESRWPYVAAKAGGLPGDLTFSWYAVRKDAADGFAQPWVVSFQLSWPRDYGQRASGWLLHIARQAFGLLSDR